MEIKKNNSSEIDFLQLSRLLKFKLLISHSWYKLLDTDIRILRPPTFSKMLKTTRV